MRSRSFLVAVAVSAMAASCSRGATGPVENPRPILGTCNLEPNYIAQVRLNRWRDFPLHYRVMESTFPDENRDQVLREIVDGIALWGLAMNGRIGLLVRVTGSDRADFEVLAQDLGLGDAAQTTHSTGTPFLSGGRIVFNRRFVAALAGREDQLLVALAAHEMGHLLGIIGHPSMEGVLMHAPLQAPGPTAADLNTMSHAYCR